VFRAFDQERDRLVAIKLFRLDLATGLVHQLVAEFERLIAAELTHPAIIAPLAAGIVDSSAYLAVDYFSAESLDQAVNEFGPAPAVDAVGVAAQLAAALDHAALVNISHGALNPRDALLSLDKDDDTRLTGIGIARALEAVGVAAPVRRPYSAPERIAGGDWDGRADIFGLAALIHELLWGRRISGIGGRAADALTEIPDSDLSALRAVFARALAERPDDRFATARQFAEALKSAFTDATVVMPFTAVERPPDSVERQPDRVVRPLDRVVRPLGRVERPKTREPGLTEDQRFAVDNLWSKDEGRGKGQVRTKDQMRTRDHARTKDLAPAKDPQPATSVRAPLSDPEPVLPPPVLDPETEWPTAVTVQPDFELEAAGEERYADVEVAPSAVPGPIDRVEPIADIHRPTAPDPTPALRAPAGSRGWLMALVLIVVAGLGFAAGYVYRNIDEAEPAPLTAAAPPPPVAPDKREFTESAVPDDRAAASTGSGRAAAPKADTAGPGPAAPLEKPANVGRLLVRSTPSGAAVFLNGRDVGRTPVALRDLETGTHGLRVVRDGYAPDERRVVLSPERPVQSIIMTLEPRRGSETSAPEPAVPETFERYSGALLVESRPSGASVFIDNQLVGTTPLSIEVIRAGEHALRLEYEGYRRWTAQVRVVASEQGRVTASLER
jgi:serine/threonine protein kinase